jgi:hypothetical protein
MIPHSGVCASSFGIRLDLAGLDLQLALAITGVGIPAASLRS